ncbi:MAG: cytochrome b/b6 domain-containing protein [Leucothrix sp.]
MRSMQAKSSVKVWDLPIRLFHWALVVAIVTSWASVKLENMELHVTSGACIFGLLIFRLLWGIWGASTAQFHRFIPSPRTLINYLKNKPTHLLASIGHSPIAALSVVAMLVVLMGQVATGLVADDDVYTTGPLIDYVESETSEWATGLHVTNSDVLLGLIALHLAAIAFYRFVKKRRLVKPMLTGKSDEYDADDIENPLVERPLLVFLLTAAVSSMVPYAIFNWL